MSLGLSVREFVAPLEPAGSLDARRSPALEEDPMALGARLHARVQKRLAQEDARVQGEVSVQAALEDAGFQVLVRGRIDLLVASSPPVVEEIKTSFRPAAILEDLASDPDHPFALQAKMYAWIRWRDAGEVPLCRIRVISLVDESETLEELPFDPAAFTLWVAGRIREIHEAWDKAQARRAERKDLGARLAFPFPDPRPGQARLVELVASSLAAGRRMLLQAPTGLGKTAAVLFPALARALEDDLRVFYCTPRNSQHEVAEDCVRRIRAQGHAVRSVTIKAKEKVCPREEVDCRPEVCPRAHLYFDRLKASGAVDALMAGGCADAPAIKAAADEHVLCPFELSLDAARRADVIIGDYNYAFAPNATLVRFFGTPEDSGRNIVLVDEAHNLPSRATDWFSPALEIPWLEELGKKRLVPRDRALRTRLTAQIRRCVELLRALEGPHRVVEPDPQPFLGEEFRITRLLAETAARGVELKPAHPLVELQRAWSDFCAVLRVLAAPHIVTWIPPGRLQITCADASAHLRERMAGLHSAVLFSATLKPFLYHRRLAGLADTEVVEAEVPSPFPPAHRKLLVVPQISTLYRLRDREMPRIAHFLGRILPLRPGNYFVFFPSFEMLEKTLPHLDLPGFQVLAQPRRAGAARIQELVGALRSGPATVVLAVQGGSLSEGIDLPGDALIGCVVAGPPLPPFDLERDRMRAYFQAAYGCGQAYAYTYPAAAKAVQAAGRVIRTPEDRGLLVFLDGRFLEADYAACFPEGWFLESPAELVSGSILADIAAFWETRD